MEISRNYKTIVITGATSFIGKELVEIFVKYGWRVVVVVCRNSKKIGAFWHKDY